MSKTQFVFVGKLNNFDTPLKLLTLGRVKKIESVTTKVQYVQYRQLGQICQNKHIKKYIYVFNL